MKVSENFSTVTKNKNNYPNFGIRFTPKGVLKRDPQIVDEFALHNNNPLNHLQDVLNPSTSEPAVAVYCDAPGEFKFYGARLKGEIKHTSPAGQKISEVLAAIQPKIRAGRKPLEDSILKCKEEFKKLNELSTDEQIKTLKARLNEVNTILGRNEISLNQTFDANRVPGRGYLESLEKTIMFLIEDV